MPLINKEMILAPAILKNADSGHNIIYRQVYTKVHDVKMSNYSRGNPPYYFQNINNLPITMDRYHNGYTVAECKQKTVRPIQTKIGIIELFTNSRTRRATVSLISGIVLLNCAICYQLLQSRQLTTDSERKLQHTIMENQVSKSVMAVHIGMLRKQLLDHNLIPVSSSKALLLSTRVLDLNQNDGGNVCLDTRSISHSILAQLIPPHSDYDPSRVFKF
ncbi:hypothetical protein HII13_002243 [Brettanomyces bruxellensis]|nr:hypothetical protein HII13_002243 [Brettanomyces bruxellensis]